MRKRFSLLFLFWKEKNTRTNEWLLFRDVIFLVNNNNQTTTFSAVLDAFTDAAADDDTVGKEMDGVVVVLVAAREWFLF